VADRYQNIILFGNARWQLDHLGNSAQQLSNAFLQLGYRVLFISPHRMARVRLPKYGDKFLGISLETRYSRFLGIVSKALSALLSSHFSQNWNRLFYSAPPLRTLEKIAKKWGCDPSNTVFICSFANKTARILLEYFSDKKFKMVYRHVDWFDTSHEKYGYDKSVADYACQVADLITISHPELTRNLPENLKKPLVSTNGIDLSLWCSQRAHQEKPPDIFQGEITIGFWGTFWGDCIDWGLIRFLAARNPDWQINLIADRKYLNIDSTSLPPNIHLLGFKPTPLLPAYLDHFDVCLIPFRQDMPFAKYANPIKALEYLSGCKPVVTPYNESLIKYPGIFFFRSRQEAIEQICKAKKTRPDALTVTRFLSQNTWQKKAESILHALGGYKDK